MKNPVSNLKTAKDNYIGNIQVSKGMLWAKMKREQVENSKFLNKIFPSKGSFLTKKNQTTTVSERHSLKSTSSATSLRSSFSRLKTNSPTPRPTKADLSIVEPKPESKLMAQSKKISKYQPSTQMAGFKKPMKKQPTIDVSIKMPRKVFKEDMKRSSSQTTRDSVKSVATAAATARTPLVNKSLDLKNLTSSILMNKDVQVNKYRAAMRVRKVPCVKDYVCC